MTELIKAQRNVYALAFPPEVSGSPVVCNLVRLYDLTFNLLQASISPRKDGAMVLELMGAEENVERGLAYLRDHGVRVSPAGQSVTRDENSCVHCGLCTALCPNGSLALNARTREVVFNAESCVACGLCTRVCPVKAMQVDLDSGEW